VKPASGGWWGEKATQQIIAFQAENEIFAVLTPPDLKG
jgi:hypothetical protein